MEFICLLLVSICIFIRADLISDLAVEEFALLNLYPILDIRLQYVTEYLFWNVGLADQMKRLNKKFIVSRISELPTVPISWAFKNINQQNVFTLDVRMCELNDFKNQCSFLFDGLKFQSDTTLTQHGGSTSQINLLNLETKIFSRSDLILKLDLSLNNITVLKIQDLEPFSQLRRLDASLNRIDSFTGIMSCSQLTHLCLAYNNIRDIPWKSLEECPHLNNIVNHVHFLIYIYHDKSYIDI